MSRGDGDPVVRMIEAMRPVELGIVPNQLVHDREGNLRVAELVQSSERRHRSPCAVATEARASQVAEHGSKLRQRKRRRVELQAVLPGSCELLEILVMADSLVDRVNRGVFRV